MSPRRILDLLKATVSEVIDDDVMSLSAAVAYYTVFALPPLLVTIAAVAGAFFGADAVREALFGQVEGLAGGAAAAEIEVMIANASDLGQSPGTKVMGLLALLVGASGAFGELQAALDRAWEIKPSAQKGGLVGMAMKRVLSFGMVLTIGFLLLVSLAVSTVLSAVGGTLEGAAPSALSHVLVEGLNFVVSLGVSTLLFGALFVVLPDRRVAWRDVWVGALFTALLFAIGKTLIGLYIGSADPGGAFGAAGSLVLVLLWIYYSALIVLVGAEFTQVWAHQRGSLALGDPAAEAGEARTFPKDTLPIRT